MRARDVMTAPALVVPPDAKVEDIAKLLLGRGISAAPVTGSDGRLAGIVSEGDLMRRVESGTERRPSWWLAVFGSEDALARDYAKSRGRHAADVMTREARTPYEGIVAAARKSKCDLIFIASHGRRGLSKLMTGSVTQKVLAHATVPVLVYR